MQFAVLLAGPGRGAATAVRGQLKLTFRTAQSPTAAAARYPRRLSASRPRLGQPGFTSWKSFASFESTSAAGFSNKAAEGYSHGSSKSQVRICSNFCVL